MGNCIRFIRLVLTALFGALVVMAAVVPGVIIDHSPRVSGQYIGSPSIAILPNGQYVATHDIFGPHSDMKREGITRVFRSSDRGRSWRHLTDIQGQFWSTLFVHRNALYLIGTNREGGDVVIRKSLDGGTTWTKPKDASTGLLLRGQYHCAPQPVVVHRGRIWRGMEFAKGEGGWPRHLRPFMMSAPQDADLLKAENWIPSNQLAGDDSWLGGQFSDWLEGNAVVTPDGAVVDILRVDYKPGGIAAMVVVSQDGKTASFDPRSGFIELPGGATKFTIRYDPKTRRYWSLVNWVAPRYRAENAAWIRNTVALVSSADLKNWEMRCIVLHHPDTAYHAFQYLDWNFDGADMAVVSRTAWDDDSGGAHDFHDANFMTFHRLRRFREMRLRDSVVDPTTLR